MGTCKQLSEAGVQHPGTNAESCSQAKGFNFLLRARSLSVALNVGETWSDLHFLERGLWAR